LIHEDEAMGQDRSGARSNGAWPWVILLLAAGLIALAVVLWQSEAVRLLWGILRELLRSRRGS
jgi:di/tricarboxylate transporter